MKALQARQVNLKIGKNNIVKNVKLQNQNQAEIQAMD